MILAGKVAGVIGAVLGRFGAVYAFLLTVKRNASRLGNTLDYRTRQRSAALLSLPTLLLYLLQVTSYFRAQKNRFGLAKRFFLIGCYQAKCANALFASAMRWVFSRLVIAAPSRL